MFVRLQQQETSGSGGGPQTHAAPSAGCRTQHQSIQHHRFTERTRGTGEWSLNWIQTTLFRVLLMFSWNSRDISIHNTLYVCVFSWTQKNMRRAESLYRGQEVMWWHHRRRMTSWANVVCLSSELCIIWGDWRLLWMIWTRREPAVRIKDQRWHTVINTTALKTIWCLFHIHVMRSNYYFICTFYLLVWET